MKTALLVVVASLTTASFAETVHSWLTTARAAELRGDTTAARIAYQKALKIQPNHPQALYQFREFQIHEKKIASRATQHQLKQVKIPEIQFDRVELLDALEALTLLIAKETRKQFTPNFVIKDPKDAFKGTTIHLKLKDVPADVALRMLLEQANAKPTWDTHAIIITPSS